MQNFFDIYFFQQVVSGLVVLFVSILLGNKTTKDTVKGKGWKVVMILSWIMILGGLYIAALNAQNGGLNNPFVYVGFGTAFLGLLLKHFARFFLWWHY